MSTVKRGYGYGDHGHGHSKPLIKYHSQKAPASVTTVVTETMRVNEKTPCAATVQKKHILMEEEEAGVNSGRHGAGNVQKHAFLAENAGVYSGHRGVTVQNHVGSAVPTNQYREQKEESDSSEESGDESDCGEELAYGQYGTGGVQNHGYGGQQAYQDEGYGALHHHSTAQKKHGYGKRGAYEGDVAGYGDYGQQNVQGYQRQKRFLMSYLVIWNPWGKNTMPTHRTSNY